MRDVRKAKGFTLIELLIVVAIIAILALIAVPNFLEAQTRAKVSRVKNDMRSLATALEAYRVDYNGYPLTRDSNWRAEINEFPSLSTPIAYITTLDILDPFVQSPRRTLLPGQDFWSRPFVVFVNREWYGTVGDAPGFSSTRNGPGKYSDFPWLLHAFGPDRIRGPNPDGSNGLMANYGKSTGCIGGLPLDDVRYTTMDYDPTNGTVSGGDIIRRP